MRDEGPLDAKIWLNGPLWFIRLEWAFSGSMSLSMHFFAAATAQLTAVERLRQIPNEFWINMGAGIAGIILLVVVLRKIAHVNKLFLGVGVFLFATIVGFNWIYERNEPTWASPAVRWIANYFPTKGKIEAKGRS